MTQVPIITPEWQAEIDEAQRITRVAIGDRIFSRIVYGAEPNLAGLNLKERCHDCAARLGELHVIGCDTERCPLCSDQAAFCACEKEVMPDDGELLH